MSIWSCHCSVKPVNGFPLPLGQSWNLYPDQLKSSWCCPRPGLQLHFQPLSILVHCSGALPLSSFPALGFWTLTVASLTVFHLAHSRFLREVLIDWMPQSHPSAEALLFLHVLVKSPLGYWPNNQTTQAKKSFLNKDTNPMITVMSYSYQCLQGWFSEVQQILLNWLNEWMFLVFFHKF